MKKAEQTWKPIPEFAGAYEVSDQGNVRSMNRTIKMKNRWGGYTCVRHTGKMLRRGTNRHGYKTVMLSKQGIARTGYVHRLVLLAFIGPPQIGQECRHLDGDAANNRLDNLCWGTAQQNSDDKVAHGSMAKGKKIHGTILTEKDVMWIREEHANKGTSITFMSHALGVSTATVSLALSGKNWKYLPVLDTGSRETRHFGESNGASVLTEHDVAYIRSFPKRYGSVLHLAKMFGVHPSTIHRVLNGSKWNHTKPISAGASLV